MKKLGSAVLFALLGTAAAQAATLTITLDSPTQAGKAGQTLAFFGTITNLTSGTVFLNNDGFTLGGKDLTFIDDFGNTPPSLAPGEVSQDVELFDVLIGSPLTQAPGTYLNSYSLLGGGDGNADVTIGSTTFAVTTVAAASAVPEPGTLSMVLGGLAGILPIVRKRLG